MIETRRLKNVVIFIQTILSFVLSGKIINICNDIARKYRNFTVKIKKKHSKTRLDERKTSFLMMFFIISFFSISPLHVRQR